MSQSPDIHFRLLDNARDSLSHAVELLAWKDIGTDHTRLKHAITNSAHAVELLLKERLRLIHPAFIWEKIDKYPSLEAQTVNVSTAIVRLERVGGVELSQSDKNNLKSLRNTRNAIEHYEWSTSEKEAKLIVGNALSFAFSFADQELGIDLAAEFKRDDTWRALLQELTDFVRAYGKRIAERLQENGEHPEYCEECDEYTVPYDGGSCELCGHWP
ncbi:hypothetical protein LY622_10675 [Halomonas sp. M5N1S17]|uniref:hypothetical protein n=1 Tax=Halomonas alkalisoli TaxID=2907158 RepID=UPI001F3013D2|nr:hypothetical protein [Halomonas alkalisoli]MCE9663908.1 hypothetical protein [Halomonas alkalisoli]